jgi:hypothetical protein
MIDKIHSASHSEAKPSERMIYDNANSGSQRVFTPTDALLLLGINCFMLGVGFGILALLVLLRM